MNANPDDDNDDIQLSADTLLILNQFLEEQKSRQNLATTKLEQQTDNTAAFHVFEENWQLSQFWYDESTKETLAKACQKILESSASNTNQVALLSCPSLYENMVATNPNAKVLLFEFDQRFSIYKENFIHYDYTLAEDEMYLNDYRESFDIIIADPPFLSEECILKMSHLIKRLSHSNTKIILCSGKKVSEWSNQFMNLNECQFQPKHNRNLANEFTSFANFNLDDFIIDT